MQKRVLEKYLADKDELINRLTIHPRDLRVTPKTSIMTSIIGPRRTGKTYLFYNLAREWTSKGYIYLNFEDVELQGMTIKDILEVPHLYQEIHGRPPALLLFDEVQRVDGWERAVKQLYEEKSYSILVTGSSSKMLSKEIATELRGRSITLLLLPLSFREFLRFRNITMERSWSGSFEARLKHELEVHMGSGGLPDVTLNLDQKSKILDNYRELVIYRDVVERHHIRNLPVLNSLMTSLISSFGNKFSFNKVYRTLDSQGLKVSKKTIYQYFGHLEDSLFVLPVWKFTWSPRKTKQTIPKVYLANTGISTNLMGHEAARLMENEVLLELLRKRDQDPALGIYYWSDSRNEADFVITRGREPVTVLQVTYSLTPDNIDRELNGLLRASADLECKDILLITWDQEGIEEFKGVKIEKIPLFKWLLGKS